MKIAIDVSPLESGHRRRGVGFYVERLKRALERVDKRNSYIFFTRTKKLPRCDLIHYPYFDLFFLTLPLVKSGKTVVTIHDVIPLVFPQKFPKGIKGWIKFQIQKLSLKGVEAVITDSYNSKKDIVRFLHFPEERIFVVPLAPGEEFKKLEIGNCLPREARRAKWGKLEIGKKYSLPQKFILYVGDVNWNKNIPGLVKAFSKLKSNFSALKLVLVGRAFLEENLPEVQNLLQLFRLLKCGGDVLRLGFVPTEDLVAIYNLASVYVQPSFYEGFGLPVLEALSCGTPVVCARTSSLPEVGGKVAIYVNPYDIDDIARGISEVLRYDAMTRHKRVEEGLRWAKRFSWEKTAKETIKVYEKIVKGEFPISNFQFLISNV